MPELVKAITCPSCGAPTASKSPQCSYCGNYLLHLTPFERKAAPEKPEAVDTSIHYFRSLKHLYRLIMYAGIAMAGIIYVVMFDSLSETELVNISPIWFLLIIFGTCGLYTEKAVLLILNRQADTFAEALNKAVSELKSPVSIVLVYVVFSLPFLIFGVRERFSSPLIISLLTTLLWAGALYFFLIAIFPEL
ncbi:MAG: hypothetical protein AAF587_20260 [Bacteroidota bacterium]